MRIARTAGKGAIAMKLSRDGLRDRMGWEDSGVALPCFDVEKITACTRACPRWVHFGAGNIFRSYIAKIQQRLLNLGKSDFGIITADTFDFEIIDKIYRPFDNLSLLVLMHPDGTLEKEVLASVSESLKATPQEADDWARLRQVFCSPSLQMASFTITEKGYAITDLAGRVLPAVQRDIDAGPQAPSSGMGIVTSLLLDRFRAGAMPIAMVSMDNCSHNGDKLYHAVQFIARKWQEKEFVGQDFLNYINSSGRVSFPWTMIDKITPRPSAFVRDALEKDGIEGMEILTTNRHTVIAPFVNAEAPEYLVVEDEFPNGRPPLEQAGVLFADRTTVNNSERMKVTTCLNPLHTALAVFGCLLNFPTIAGEMEDPDLRALVEKIGYQEGMPVVINPIILNPLAFIREVIEKRLPNPYIPDTPQRIATDTSQKLSVRFGETIKSYRDRPDLDIQSLTFIPLAIAAWCRYLMGVDDEGNPMELSPDPMLEELTAQMAGAKLGEPASADGVLRPILCNPVLFGVDLYDVGLGEKIEGLFCELIAGPGAVRQTLHRLLTEPV